MLRDEAILLDLKTLLGEPYLSSQEWIKRVSCLTKRQSLL